MKERCDWRLYINKNDKKESYFLNDLCVRGNYKKGNRIRYGSGESFVTIDLHENLYLAAAFNDEDVVNSINLDTMHAGINADNIYSRYKHHHATLIMLKSNICILMETNDDDPYHSGEVLASTKSIRNMLKNLETDITLNEVYQYAN